MPIIEDHGDWIIWHDPLPIKSREYDWHYARKAARDETDVGHASNRDMALQTIDYLQQCDDEEQEPEFEVRLETESIEALERFKNVPLILQLGSALLVAIGLIPPPPHPHSSESYSTRRGRVLEAANVFESWKKDQE